MTPTRDVLLGRERELQLLDNVLDGVCDGDPGFVVISGEAGIGKTRLLQEVLESAVSRGCLTLEGRAAEFERELPFGVLADALDDYLRSLDERALERLATDRLGALAAVFPSLGALDEAVDYPISALERFRVYHAVRELVERLAARSPVVLFLDDLHWADGASLELIASLLRRPPQAAVMLAMAVRTGHPTAIKAISVIQRSSIVHTIELGPLTEDDVMELVGGGDGLDVGRLHHASGGNPFFALQLARAEPGGADATTAGEFGVPPAVARAISAELEELSPAARELAEAAAVVGDPFELDLAAATIDRPEADVWERIDELVAKDFVRRTDVPRRFQFRHPLVRHAVYGSCSPSLRVSFHRRAIDGLATRGAPAAAMAGHVEQCARHGDAFAIDILRRAGEETSRRAPRSAAPWFAAAVRLLPAEPPSPERVGLLMSLAAAEAAIGRFSEAHAALAECVALVSDEDVELRVGLVVATAEIEQLLGRHNEARVRLQRAYEELTDRDSPARVSLLIALSTNSLYLADHRGMLDWGRLAVDAADKVGSETLAAASLAACAMGATFAGRVDLARDLHGRAVRLVDSLADDELLSRLDALSNLATAELYLDLHALTSAHGERGLSLARSTGRTQLVPILIPILGCSLWMTGELERSAEVLDEAIEGARLVDNAQGLSLALFNRALSAVMAGVLETGLQMGAESVELARTVDDGVITAFAGAIHAQVLCEAGEPEQAVELLLESVGGEDIPLLAGSWRATYFELLTRCCLELGQVDDARAAAQKVREQAEEQGLQLSGLMADRAGAAVALADGRPEDATALALSAVARSEEIGARVHAATSRALAGRALSAAGRSDEAIAQLVRAADAFDELGASRYRDQVEAQLRGLGKTIRRRTRRGRNDGSGMELLTGRELEVAELLCDHLTNREIAGELFLSLKTIEAHMRSIFQKLGVSSRREVAELVAQARRAGSGA